MDTETTSAVADFWLAVGRNNLEEAEAAVLRLETPLVSVSSGFSFDMVEGEGKDQGVDLEDEGALMGASPRGVMPGTPMSTIDAWNSDVGVSLIVVSKQGTCGARVSEGDIDFLACAGATERAGAAGCGFTTHEFGGKDSLKRPVVKMAFPEAGEGFAILVKPSGSVVKRPKIFSLPILARVALPYPQTIDWDLPLTSFKFKAREWKFLIEEYKGVAWFASLWMGGHSITPPPALQIPSPRMGREFVSQDFQRYPEDTRSRVSEADAEGDNDRPPSPPGGSAVPPLFPMRTDSSHRSSRSGGSVNSRGHPAPVERLAPLLRRLGALETRASLLEDSLPTSFVLVRDELDEIWKDLRELERATASRQGPSQGSTFFQARGSTTTPAPPAGTLAPPAFENLMRRVVDELKSAGFVLQSDLDSRMLSTVPSDIADQLSGLGRRLGSIERELRDPDGTLAKLEGRIKSLEDRRAGEAIERGGKTFRDLGAVSAWLQTFKDKDLYRYCVDMVTLVMLCSEAYETIAEGMANAASAFKADYNSLTEARIAFSYGMTYPENLMKKQDKQKHVVTGGWFWTPSWSSYSAFKGTFNNGAKDNITSSLTEVSGMIQNAIDFAFPLATLPLAHAVFTEQLLLSRAQATAWIDAIEPLYEILTAAGMGTDDAWERVLIFCKAVFDDIRTVRAITLDTKNTAGMIWGSFRATKLLEEYRRLKFYQHPHVSNMLALTSLQREGKKVETVLSTLGTVTKDVEKIKSQCAQHEKDIKALKSAK